MKKISKKLSLIITLTLSLTIIGGCSNSNKSSNDTANNRQTNNGNLKTQDEAKTEKNKSEDNKFKENKAGANNETEKDQEYLLKNIETLAKEGKIINSDFADASSNISDVEEKLGEADKTEVVEAAKGIYSTYSKYNVVFGFNKGGRIFEVRSFDSRLNNISLSQVKKYFGIPDHNAKFNDEKILGYVASEDYKILFVFKAPINSNDDPKLDHYSVLYPQGTVNTMASDQGREW